MHSTSESRGAARAKLPATVVALGVTSFFTDIGSEMIFPLLPAFVASIGATPAFLGLVEGLADATSSLLKLAAGAVSDTLPRKKPLVLLGYGLATFARPLMGVAVLPWHVLAVRLTDRLGKGIRTAPRDVLLAGAVPAEQAGRAFGLHRAMDHAGAVVGPLIATALLAAGWPLQHVFLAAIVPGLLAMLALALVREVPSVVPATAKATGDAASAAAARPPLSRAYYGYLGVIALFSLGASTDAFLLLRAGELGVRPMLIPMLWVALHVSKLIASYYGGALADRFPRTRLLALGWAVYALAYLGLGFATSAWHVWALFLFYGIYYGLTEPSERALVKDLAPPEARGRAYGLYHFTIGMSAIPASVLTGWVWQAASPRAALLLGAAFAASACLALSVWSAGFSGLRDRQR